MPSTGIPGTPAATTAGAGIFAPPPDLTFSIGATEEAAARRAGRRRPATGFARSSAVERAGHRRPATGFARSSAVERRQVELRPASAAHRARRKAERRTADRIRGGAHAA